MSAAAHVSAGARLRSNLTLETAVRPHTLLLVGAGLSFLAWAIPWGGAIPAALRYASSQPWTLHGMLFLVGWYAFFFAVGFGGFYLGRRIPVLQRAERVPWESFYVFFTILSLVGTAYSYGYVAAHSPHAISAAFLHHRFNAVRYALPYAAGAPTLRYAASLAGAIAIFELGRGRLRAVHVFNVLLLLLSAAIASRVSLIIAGIVVEASLRGTFKPRGRRRDAWSACCSSESSHCSSRSQRSTTHGTPASTALTGFEIRSS